MYAKRGLGSVQRSALWIRWLIAQTLFPNLRWQTMVEKRLSFLCSSACSGRGTYPVERTRGVFSSMTTAFLATTHLFDGAIRIKRNRLRVVSFGHTRVDLKHERAI